MNITITTIMAGILAAPTSKIIPGGALRAALALASAIVTLAVALEAAGDACSITAICVLSCCA